MAYKIIDPDSQHPFKFYLYASGHKETASRPKWNQKDPKPTQKEPKPTQRELKGAPSLPLKAPQETLKQAFRLDCFCFYTHGAANM